MATFTGTSVKTSASTEEPQWLHTGLSAVIMSAAVTDALTTNDVITGPYIPAGAYLVDVIVDTTDLDTDVSPTVEFTVGISGTAAKFISASSKATTGGIARMNVASALGYTPASDTQVILTVTAAATAAAAGTIKIGVIYTNSP